MMQKLGALFGLVVFSALIIFCGESSDTTSVNAVSAEDLDPSGFFTKK